MKKKLNIELRDKAWRFILDNGINRLPVDLFRLAEKLGYTIMSYADIEKISGISSKTLEKKYSKKGISYLSAYGNHMIFYNAEQSKEEARWTIMHEIAHIHLGHVNRKAQTRIQGQDLLKESLADGFSRRILCPSIVLHKCNAIEPEEIMTLCGISKSAANIRSTYMKRLKTRDKFLTHPLEKMVFAQFLAFIVAYKKSHG